MPNNSSSWVCSACKIAQKAKLQQGTSTYTSKQPPVKTSATNQATAHQPHAAPQPTIYQSHAATQSTTSQPHAATQSTTHQPHAATQPTFYHTHAATQPTARQAYATQSDNADVICVKTVINPSISSPKKYDCQGSMGPYEYGLIQNPTGWLDCVVIQSAQISLKQINTNIQGFQRPTLGPVRQFDVMTGYFIQM